MIIEKIEAEFRQYPGKRCLFLFDPAKEYEKELQSAKLDNEDQQSENTSNHINLLSEPFISQLNSMYPDLSFEELRMCKYLKLKFTTKEIADKLNLTYRGAETKRYRLRKKLQTPKGISIFRHLENLMSKSINVE